MQVAAIEQSLPADFMDALLIGRVWRPAPIDGPSVIVVRGGIAFDITAHVATVADLLDMPDPAARARALDGECLGPVQDLLNAALARVPGDERPRLLAPCDVQPIKACGVTFTASLLERVIEEGAKGDPSRAEFFRSGVHEIVGTDLASIRPGSAAAQRLKAELIARDAWSQYLEVGIGSDAEVFTKSQSMSAVGYGAQIGIHPDSAWNNPEPEIVLAVNSRGDIVGATLGNDVNLRDFEGRSALLLGKAKDNNASCAIGPFIRLFDGRFDLDAVRRAEVTLRIEGRDDDFLLEGVSDMREISRDPLDLVGQTWGEHHQYPDGFMLFLGTMFSPNADRDAVGGGFTHHLGDRVTIECAALGALVNEVQLSTGVAKWTFGVRALYQNLHGRGIGAAAHTNRTIQ